MNSNMTVGPSFNGMVTVKKIIAMGPRGGIKYGKAEHFSTSTHQDKFIIREINKLIRNNKSFGAVIAENKAIPVTARIEKSNLPANFSKGRLIITKKYNETRTVISTSIENLHPTVGDTQVIFKAETNLYA